MSGAILCIPLLFPYHGTHLNPRTSLVTLLFRLAKIFLVFSQNLFNRRVLPKRTKCLRALSYLNPFSYTLKHTRGVLLRTSLEKLGPIYVKFGQLLSTRFDMLPEDVLVELEKLQDRVPPFASTEAVAIIEKTFQQPIQKLFNHFDKKPLASASIAQVHAATLKTGEDVVLKILRPHIKKIIHQDIHVLKFFAKMLELFWKHGKRLRAVAIVNEFRKTTFDELDLMREAANASQLRRNFSDAKMMYVPRVYWDFTRDNIMTMERIYGVQISDIASFKKNKVNLKRLAEYGVEIFFTQVFRDAFFHADMHPGNLFVDISDPNYPSYLGIDFGIMGTLTPSDQNYLAENILAFLSRDYRKVAELHIESGWVNKATRIDEFESAIRTVCEPIFEKPLSQISFGGFLLKLFQTAERFDMHVQPQLVLLQKTLFYVESLGRKLYPDLDIFETAKPFMTQWMRQQKSPTRLFKLFLKHFNENSEALIKLPALLVTYLTNHSEKRPL